MAEILPEDGTAGTLIGRVQGRDGPTLDLAQASPAGREGGEAGVPPEPVAAHAPY